MGFSISSLFISKPMAGIQGLSNMVMSAFASGAERNKLEISLGGADSSSPDNCQKSLLTVIEAQIIPQLMQAHTHAQAHPSVHKQARIFTAEEIEQFSESCLGNEIDQPLTYIQGLIDDGVSIESVFIDLITPAARWLGYQWELDKKDFTAVTHGLMRMHQLTRSLGYINHESPQAAGEVKRIFLACAPGSMHILGLSIVTEMFRSDGWQVVMEIASTEEELFKALRREWFDMIGLSVGLVEQLPGMKDLIARLRAQAINPQTLVILGGPAVTSDPNLLQKSGADGVSSHAPQAIALANRLIRTD
ncbi:MAG: B12-binding domain-containing protein [Limnohabitans sp.]